MRITIEQALELLNVSYKNDPEKSGFSVYKRQTIYNAISDQRLTNYGPRHRVLLDPKEVLKIFGPKKKKVA